MSIIELEPELEQTIPADVSGGILPVQSEIIVVPGLIPPLSGHGNLVSKLDEIARTVWKQHPWFHSLVAEAMDHKTSATVIVVAGGLTVLVGTYELGIRHGEDLKAFYDRMQPHWPNMRKLLSVARDLSPR